MSERRIARNEPLFTSPLRGRSPKRSASGGGAFTESRAPLPNPPPRGRERRLSNRRKKKSQAAVPPREARRARLGRARQAGRHDLDACGRRRQAAVLGQARRPRRHARSAGLRLPADRARRGDQDRSVRHGRPQALSLHRALGRGARHRRRRRPRGRDERGAPGPRRDRGAAAGATPAPSRRCRRNIRRSRSTASAPTISPATARRSICQARPVEIHRLELVNLPDADTAEFEAECGKGTYVRSLARDIGRALGCFGHIKALRREAVGSFQRKRHDFAGTTDRHVS